MEQLLLQQPSLYSLDILFCVTCYPLFCLFVVQKISIILSLTKIPVYPGVGMTFSGNTQY